MNGAGFYSYWGTAGGPSGQGWRSLDLGAWHVVVLNANCGAVGCGTGGAQETWLRNDLAAHTQACTLALFHEPLYTSSSEITPNTAIQPLWQDLYNFNVDLVVNGHGHNYERFAPQDANGSLSLTWKTDRSWGGSCQALIVPIDSWDGATAAFVVRMS